MASKAKESSGLGKERRNTAPTSIPIPNTQTKRTPKSSPRGPPSTNHKLPLTSSSTPPSTLPEKPIPNYLKFTASSRPDPTTFKPNKKPSPTTQTPEGKPSLNRRRSFDKPHSTESRLDKPFQSPEPRSRANHVPVRSSSFGDKSSTVIISSPKPGLLERSSSKISKVSGGKPQLQVQTSKSSSNVKKSLKRESSNAGSTSAAETVTKTKNVEQSPSFVLGMSKEDLKTIQHEHDPCLPDPMPVLNKELSSDQAEKEADAEKDTETLEVDFANKEVDETQPAADAESPIGEEVNQERAEDETVEVVSTVESEESTENKSKEKIVPEEEEAEDEQSYKEENHNSTTEKEAEAAENKVEEVAEKAAAAAVEKTRQEGLGRKESPPMYNHVIEETASKLLEERKNKVRALAGAFQTVIDYESSSK